jgi:hypothetical protein
MQFIAFILDVDYRLCNLNFTPTASGVHWASTRNVYQEYSWFEGSPTRKADTPTAVCKPTV